MLNKRRGRPRKKGHSELQRINRELARKLVEKYRSKGEISFEDVVNRLYITLEETQPYVNELTPVRFRKIKNGKELHDALIDILKDATRLRKICSQFINTNIRIEERRERYMKEIIEWLERAEKVRQ